MKRSASGFTIVEVLIVIVVIAILAAVSVVAYRGVQQRAFVSTMSSDLQSAARAFELYKADNDRYPVAGLPSGVKTSNGVTLSATVVTGNGFCLNAYHQGNTSLKVSWDSNEGLKMDSLCSGATIGNTAGGSVPLATRSTNIMPEFSQWTLAGTATYNAITKEVTIGPSGSASSPLVRVDQPAVMRTGGDMYATVASAHPEHAPNGSYHISISYYGSDGTTPAQNAAGYTGNGCARNFTLGAWQIGSDACVFTGGAGIMYVSYTFVGPSGGRTSSDLKIKTPLLLVTD